MKNKKSLIMSVIIFIIVAVISLIIVLNKGHIGNWGLVSLEDNAESDKIIPTIQLELEKDVLSSVDEETSKIKAIIDGAEANEGLTVESSDENIAKINEDNEIVAVSDGRATIKVIYDGIEQTKDIKVITPIKTLSFTSTSSTVRVGRDLQLKLKATPSDASIETLTYTSSDESIATVNNNGIVTGVSSGKVTITVTDSYTGIEKSVNLTIKK